jgi:beta-glucosidase
LRVLITKFRLGLFDHPYVDENKAEEIVGNPQKRAVAYKAATEGMVLLKNDNNFLPLDKSKIKTIAFIGPNADKCLLGGYSDKPRFMTSPLQAIKEKYGKDIKILYSEGVRITDKNDWFADKINLVSAEENQGRITAAVEIAKQADVVVLFVGGSESTSREAFDVNHLGDLPTLELLANQNDLIKAVVATGKPTCAFVNSGPPLSITYLTEAVPAIMQCWYLGQEGGYAMVDALFGTVNPSGKLPISFPRTVGHIPAYYNYKPSAKRGYNLGFQSTPLFAFGHGLSYTTFIYSNLRISSPTMKKDGSAKVSIDIKNTGTRNGSETVQMYIRDIFSSVTRPVKELKGFKKINLNVGETQTVNFTITPELLSFYDKDMNWIVEPGDFEIMVGTASDNNTSINLKVD